MKCIIFLFELLRHLQPRNNGGLPNNRCPSYPHVVWPEITASLSYLVSQTIWFKQTNQNHSLCVTNFSSLPPFPGLQEFLVYILPVLLV